MLCRGEGRDESATNYSYFNKAGDQRLQQIENLKPDASYQAEHVRS